MSSATLLEKLQLLGCPYTDGIQSDTYVADLLTKPGEHRLRLLVWLFAKYSSELHDMIEIPFSAGASKFDQRIQRILYVSATLGLCRHDEIQLISGEASASRQLAYFDTLIDIVLLKDELSGGQDPQPSDFISSTSKPGFSDKLQSEYSKTCSLLQSIYDYPGYHNMFSKELELLPPDLQIVVNDNWRTRGKSASDPPPVPDLKELHTKMEKLDTMLAQQNELLTKLRASGPLAPETDADTERNVTQKLGLVLSELAQLMANFRICFEQELRPWCEIPPRSEEFSALGPCVKRVHGLAMQCHSMLDSIAKLREHHRRILSASNSQSTSSSCKDIAKQLESYISVLNENQAESP